MIKWFLSLAVMATLNLNCPVLGQYNSPLGSSYGSSPLGSGGGSNPLGNNYGSSPLSSGYSSSSYGASSSYVSSPLGTGSSTNPLGNNYGSSPLSTGYGSTNYSSNTYGAGWGTQQYGSTGSNYGKKYSSSSTVDSSDYGLGSSTGTSYGVSNNSVHVDGYYKKNGTYVAPHYRTSPNDTTQDNYSTRGNVNPYTGQGGEKSTITKVRKFLIGF